MQAHMTPTYMAQNSAITADTACGKSAATRRHWMTHGMCFCMHCPLHKTDRAVMLRTVRTALHSARLTLEDIGSDTAIVQLLLGSMPVTAAHALSTRHTAHRDILRASSKYLRIVYDTRWKYGHNFPRQREAAGD